VTYADEVPSAKRALQLLELLAATPEGLMAGEIEATLEIPHSALFALLNTLTSMGYLTQSGPRQPYRPGPRLHALRHPQPPGTHALTQAFTEETTRHPPEETVALATLSSAGEDDAEVLFLAATPCEREVRSVIRPGERARATEHPAGWVLLAGLSSGALTQHVATPTAALHSQLDHVREQAMAEQAKGDAHRLAVPICADGRHPEAALVISVPTFRWTPARRRDLAQTLRESAARISYRLGALTYRPYGEARPHHLGASVAMSAAERRSFLTEPWAARLACIRPDGAPHVVPVWYEWRDDACWIAAWPGSVWAGFVRQNPAVALTIDEPWPPMRRVLLRGRAAPIPDDEIPGGMAGLRQRLSNRYVGAPLHFAAEEVGWQAFRIAPNQIVAQREEIVHPVDG
jgi:DNA-binding IclR family transcriptional regulator/nitroimidazol reductase NimA-like FMN-containing flavoprotein (pyridoxamine 5'-phosphate oxidase superfamily)